MSSPAHPIARPRPGSRPALELAAVALFALLAAVALTTTVRVASIDPAPVSAHVDAKARLVATIDRLGQCADAVDPSGTLPAALVRDRCVEQLAPTRTDGGRVVRGTPPVSAVPEGATTWTWRTTTGAIVVATVVADDAGAAATWRAIVVTPDGATSYPCGASITVDGHAHGASPGCVGSRWG